MYTGVKNGRNKNVNNELRLRGIKSTLSAIRKAQRPPFGIDAHHKYVTPGLLISIPLRTLPCGEVALTPFAELIEKRGKDPAEFFAVKSFYKIYRLSKSPFLLAVKTGSLIVILHTNCVMAARV